MFYYYSTIASETLLVAGLIDGQADPKYLYQVVRIYLHDSFAYDEEITSEKCLKHACLEWTTRRK